MAMQGSTSPRAIRLGMLQAVGLLIVALVHWPRGWAGIHKAIEAARSPVVSRAERDHQATGYYEGLIGGGSGPEGARGELAAKLMGKPNGWIRFNDANVAKPLPRDFLQFELRPNIERILFGQPFVTNSHGMHSPEVPIEKPAGTYRVAILGASMDMGWGVRCSDTYSQRLQDWLNHHAERHGIASDRRFEVLNFAVAAYSPLQRLDMFKRKVLPFCPDMVIYSATMLDIRLTEIHLCDILRTGTDPTYDFLRRTFAELGILSTGEVNSRGELVRKEEVKNLLQPQYWPLYDATLGELAGQCRAVGVPLVVVIIPRVGNSDAISVRTEPVARLKAIAGHHALPLYDLSDTFDGLDPLKLEIAAWDDHPNAQGHQRLFEALARGLVKDRLRYGLLFPNSEVELGPTDDLSAPTSTATQRREKDRLSTAGSPRDLASPAR